MRKRREKRTLFDAMRFALVPCALVICGCVPVPQLVKDLETTNLGSDPMEIVPTQNGFYIVAKYELTGEELFYVPDDNGATVTDDNFIDVRPGALSSKPRSVYVVGERAYFYADDGTEPNPATNPQESLYVTDGTKATTVRLRGPAQELRFTGFAPWGTGGMLFKMSDASTGEELYRTNGTASGTQMIADINPAGSSEPAGMTATGGYYVFAATDGTGDRELWRTDGTTAELVVDLDATGSSSPSGFVPFGGKVYFSATISPGATALYATDGTATGTERVSDIEGQTLALGAATSSFVLFVVNQTEVWATDGTAPGTQALASIPLVVGGTPPREFRTVGDRVVFYVGTHLADLWPDDNVWASDGTPAGTSVILPNQPVLHHGVPFASKLYYTTADSGIWRTDGTAAGTELVYNQFGFNPGLLTDLHGTLLLTGKDATRGRELWKMGTSIGPPTFFADIYQGTADSYPQAFTALGTKTVFTATVQGTGTELYVTDGTDAGTQLLAEIRPGVNGSHPHYFTEWNGILYFIADDGLHGDELWRTDGTSAGTSRVTDLYPSYSSSVLSIRTGPNTLFLCAEDLTHGFELWRTDGTAAGTQMVKDINPGTAHSQAIRWAFGSLGSQAIFTATTDSSGTELWHSDGTEAGTQMVKDINPGAADSDVFVDLVPMGGYLYFAATDGVFGKEIWRTDGTDAGTTRITDLNPAGDSTTGGLVAMGDAIYFNGFDGTRHEMWKTDGVTTTEITGAINPAGSDAFPGVPVGGTLYFTAVVDPQKGKVLFATDGTAAGVRLVKDINVAPYLGGQGDMAALGDVLYFAADDGTNGIELWSTDGTTGGTVMNSGAGNDPFSSMPRAMVAIGGKLYMQLADPVHGMELYTLTP
jgi:ELWxxDGT repeat protein